jgi:hypothetical protein
MSIAFQCPKCQKAYTVKDELAGKKVVCRTCQKPIFVPLAGASSAAPSAAVESLAVSALSEEPAAAVAEAPATFEAECPNCMEVVTWDAGKAGKQSPCPRCRRIVRVPLPSDGRPKDWRAADAKPTLARRDADPAIKDAWGNVTGARIVGRDALVEAEVIPDRKRPPLTREQKIKRGILLACLALVAFFGVWKWMGHRTIQKRQASIQEAISLLGKQKDTMPAGVRAEVYRGAAEFRLRQSGPEADEALKFLKEASGAALKSGGGANADQGPEPVVLLTEVVLTLAELPGTAEEVSKGERLNWTDVQKVLRQTFQAMSRDASQREGMVLALQRLTRRLKLAGPGNNPAVVILANQEEVFQGEDRAQAVAAVALELLGLGDDERKKAEELSLQVKGAAPSARVVALFVALRQPQEVASVRDPSAGGEPTQAARLGYAEGYARQGEYDKARTIAIMPGRFDERFQALVTVAGVALDAGNEQYVGEAVEFLERELAQNDLPDWRLIRLARLCARAKDGPGRRLRDVLRNHTGPMSPRAQTVRALTLWELLRAPWATVSEADVKAITPPTALGHLLAWEVLARRTTPASVDSWPEAVRPLGLIGTALGLQDSSK